MIVLDAAALIALLEPRDAHHDATRAFLRETEAEPRTMNPINYAEALVGPSRVGGVAQAVNALNVWQIGETQIPEDAAIRLSALRAMTGRQMPDCCAMLTAQQTGGRLLTFDTDLRESATMLGISVGPSDVN